MNVSKKEKKRVEATRTEKNKCDKNPHPKMLKDKKTQLPDSKN